MAYQPVPGVAKVSMEYTYQAAPTINTFHYEFAGVIDATELETLANIHATWDLNYNALRRSIISVLDRVVCTDLSTATGAVFELALTPPQAGANAAEAMPAQVAACTTLITAKRGRSYRGRIYWGSTTETVISASHLATGLVEDYDEAYEQLHGDCIAASWIPVVVSRYENNVLRPIGLATPIIGWRTSNVVRTQRRRLPDV